MSGLTTEEVVLACYIAAGVVAWLAFGFAMFNGHRHMMLVRRPAAPLPSPPPRVAIVVPAKDEGERIRDCIESALGQDYPDFHVVAVDDRSTDATGEILDEMAAREEKLSVIHIEEGALPEGWTGKCNALHTAVAHAEGDWLLFVDSDVVLAKDALRATVGRAVNRNYDLLSFLPRLETHSFWERVLIPLAASGMTVVYAVSLTNRDQATRTAFANGQYLFIRRSAYEEMGGHERVRDKFCEDLEIARYLKGQGYKVKISWGTDFAAVRMYNSLASIFRGWGRSFYAGSLGRPWRILAAIVFIVGCCYSAYAAAAWAVWRMVHPSGSWIDWAWPAAAGGHLLLMHVLVGVLYAWTGNKRRNSLLLPLGAAMLIGIFIKALRMCVTKEVEWRGTSYSHRMTPTAVKDG